MSSWESGQGLGGGRGLVCPHAFGICEGREGLSGRSLSVLSELVATVALSRPLQPEGCTTVAPRPEAVGPPMLESDVERVVYTVGCFVIQERSGLKADTKLCYLKLYLFMRQAESGISNCL